MNKFTVGQYVRDVAKPFFHFSWNLQQPWSSLSFKLEAGSRNPDVKRQLNQKRGIMQACQAATRMKILYLAERPGQVTRGTMRVKKKCRHGPNMRPPMHPCLSDRSWSQLSNKLSSLSLSMVPVAEIFFRLSDCDEFFCLSSFCIAAQQTKSPVDHRQKLVIIFVRKGLLLSCCWYLLRNIVDILRRWILQKDIIKQFWSWMVIKKELMLQMIVI